jgi:hypothetical protein
VTIWADVDSLQPEIRDLLERRTEVDSARQAEAGQPPRFDLVFVAARKLKTGAAARFELVESGTDAADDRIAGAAKPGDIVVTRDLPLAERLALAGVDVLNDRGDRFSAENVRERRSMRDRAADLRALGLAPESARRRSWGKKEFKEFADALDRCLWKLAAAGRA